MERSRAFQIEGARVLVVEDEYFLADDLMKALENAAAMPIGPVATLKEARSKLTEGGIDAAILDMNLRGEIAGELAEQIVRARIPCILVSGYSAEALPGTAAALPRLEKPVDTHLVIEALDAQLRAEQRWPAEQARSSGE